jgi:CheY-like chemotaxis protein
MREDEQKCLTAGMDAYLAKPIEVQNLLEAIEYWAGVPAEGAAYGTR